MSDTCLVMAALWLDKSKMNKKNLKCDALLYHSPLKKEDNFANWPKIKSSQHDEKNS